MIVPQKIFPPGSEVVFASRANHENSLITPHNKSLCFLQRFSPDLYNCLPHNQIDKAKEESTDGLFSHYHPRMGVYTQSQRKMKRSDESVRRLYTLDHGHAP